MQQVHTNNNTVSTAKNKYLYLFLFHLILRTSTQLNSTQLNFIKHICSPEAELLNTEAVLKVTRKNKKIQLIK